MEKLYKNLPETPGVYLMKDAAGRILYVGKAVNLRRRGASYFTFPRRSEGEGGRSPAVAYALAGKHDLRLEKLVREIKKIDLKKTDTALEALILESALIKKHQPPWNIREKDDTSFLYVGITDDYFPRVILVRGKVIKGKALAPSLTERYQNRFARKREERGARFSAGFGPYTSASDIREALRIIRRIFPFSTHSAEAIGKFKRPCFDYQLGLCPGTCIGIIDRGDYLKNIKNIILLFQGKKKEILKNLQSAMKSASKKLEFEKAGKIRRQIFALQHIQDTALITDGRIQNLKFKIQNSFRIEGYDISNISGLSAVGSMVVFSAQGGPASGRILKPDKNQYRKFKIGTVFGSNDTAMLAEMLGRRLNHREWPLPDLFLIDGGKPQVNAVRSVLDEFGLQLPVVGIAKGAKRKKNEFIGPVPKEIGEKTLIQVRDEAHRFAVSYHKKLRSYSSLL